MESLAPPLASLLHVRWEMENGTSFRESLRRYLRSTGADEFSFALREWMARKSHDQDVTSLYIELKSPYRLAIFDLFERGWRGEPILEPLQELEEEIRSACDSELDHFVATLPFRAMLPLLALQFPAYLLLLLGPIFTELLHGLGTL